MLVFISVLAVITYRVIMSVKFCTNAAECLLLTTILSSVFNAVSILILGRVTSSSPVFNALSILPHPFSFLFYFQTFFLLIPALNILDNLLQFKNPKIEIKVQLFHNLCGVNL